MSLVVFGSINMDLVTQVTRLPKPGETIVGHSFETLPGGKGANQAVACARLGATVYMIGRVGDDSFGARLLAGLDQNGVNVTDVAVSANSPSGIAVISVDNQGENAIVVVSGANASVGATATDDLERLEARLRADTSVLLLQLEIALPVVLAAAQMAQRCGIKVVLDPAPANSHASELYSHIDVLTPNESETAALVGFPIRDQSDAARAAAILLSSGVKAVVIKMGSQGAYAAQRGDGAKSAQFFPAFQVNAIDTVAAGDAFNGALAVALSEKLPLFEAVRWGMAAGALSATKPGAQASMPDRAAVIDLVEHGREKR